MTDYKLLIKRIGLIGATNFILGLSGIILLPILTKNLSIEDYGIWAQIIITISIVPGITMLGLPFTMTRFLPSVSSKEDAQEIFYSVFFTVIFTSGLSCILIYIFSETIALNLFGNNIIIVKIVALIAFIECINATLNSYFRATNQIKIHSILSFTQTIFFISFVAYFIFSGNGLFGATIALLLRSLSLFLIMAYIIFQDLGVKKPNYTHLKELMKFGLPTIPVNFSRWVVESSDRYVISILLGVAAVGYYSPGYALGNTIYMLIAPLSFILPATLAKEHDVGNIKDVQHILQSALKCFLVIGIPSVFTLSFLSKPILLLLTTSEIAINGYLITPFVAISALFFGIISIFNQILLLKKKTQITGKIVSLCGALNLGLNFVLIPYIGIIGAAITTLLAYIINLIFIVHYSSKSLKLNIPFLFVLKCVVASIVASLMVVNFDSPELANIIFSIAKIFIVYFLIILLLKVFSKEEIRFIKQFIKH